MMILERGDRVAFRHEVWTIWSVNHNCTYTIVKERKGFTYDVMESITLDVAEQEFVYAGVRRITIIK